MKDIQVIKVRINWDQEPPEGEPTVKLLDSGDEYDPQYMSYWDLESDLSTREAGTEPVRLLLERFVHLVILENLDPQEVHTAFMQVPEYRDALIAAGTINPKMGGDSQIL